MRLKLFFLGTIVLFFSGCISGPKNPDQTFAEKLNADSYESSNTVMGVPVLTRKPIYRKITGKVFCGEGLSQYPANHAAVVLTGENKTVASTLTDTNGNFNLLASISVEKAYKLQASSKCGNSTQDLSLKEESNYNLILKN